MQLIVPAATWCSGASWLRVGGGGGLTLLPPCLQGEGPAGLENASSWLGCGWEGNPETRTYMTCMANWGLKSRLLSSSLPVSASVTTCFPALVNWAPPCLLSRLPEPRGSHCLAPLLLCTERSLEWTSWGCWHVSVEHVKCFSKCLSTVRFSLSTCSVCQTELWLS